MGAAAALQGQAGVSLCPWVLRVPEQTGVREAGREERRGASCGLGVEKGQRRFYRAALGRGRPRDGRGVETSSVPKENSCFLYSQQRGGFPHRELCRHPRPQP